MKNNEAVKLTIIITFFKNGFIAPFYKVLKLAKNDVSFHPRNSKTNFIDPKKSCTIFYLKMIGVLLKINSEMVVFRVYAIGKIEVRLKMETPDAFLRITNT